MPYDIQSRQGTGGGASPSRTGTARRIEPDETPSSKYRDIEMPNSTVMTRAVSPPKPTLPRRSAAKAWKATTRERYPLTSSLTGPGRAGKYGELVGSTGGKYEGEVLAGRPHGHGRYLVLQRHQEWTVQYEGEWVQGRREGHGTRYYSSGESYTGDFVHNMRHGSGRYEYSNGDLYAGQWSDDKRHGAGTLYFASGDIFIGNFLADRREGMGTLYMMSRQKKYIAEYVRDSPRCGTVLELDDADLAPLKGHLAQVALARKLDAAAAGAAIARLPALQLQQPNKVLAGEVVAVRRARASGSKAVKEVQASSGTLTERDMEMLRHSYTLMAAGDTPAVGLLPHQLRELTVMAGLDPAAAATRCLVEELVRRKDTATGRINFDNFMKTVTHFQEDAVAARAAAAVEAVARATMGMEGYVGGVDGEDYPQRDVSYRPQPEQQASASGPPLPILAAEPSAAPSSARGPPSATGLQSSGGSGGAHAAAEDAVAADEQGYGDEQEGYGAAADEYGGGGDDEEAFAAEQGGYGHDDSEYGAVRSEEGAGRAPGGYGPGEGGGGEGEEYDNAAGGEYDAVAQVVDADVHQDESWAEAGGQGEEYAAEGQEEEQQQRQAEEQYLPGPEDDGAAAAEEEEEEGEAGDGADGFADGEPVAPDAADGA